MNLRIPRWHALSDDLTLPPFLTCPYLSFIGKDCHTAKWDTETVQLTSFNTAGDDAETREQNEAEPGKNQTSCQQTGYTELRIGAAGASTG